MRQVFLLFLCAMFVLNASAVDAQAPFGVPGFQYKEAGARGHVFSCVEPKCGLKSNVIITSHKFAAPWSAAEFEAAKRRVVTDSPSRKSPKFGKVIIGKSNGWTVIHMAISYRIENDTVTYLQSGYIYKGDVEANVLSFSSDRSRSFQNFQNFSRQITARPPVRF